MNVMPKATQDVAKMRDNSLKDRAKYNLSGAHPHAGPNNPGGPKKKRARMR